MYLALSDKEARCVANGLLRVLDGKGAMIDGIRQRIHEHFNPQPSEEAYREAAQSHPLVSEGTLEVDDSAIVSEGDDGGAYVMAWLWVEGDEISEEEE